MKRKQVHNNKKKVDKKIPFHYDDKGRRVFDFKNQSNEMVINQKKKDDINNMKKEQKQLREEMKKSNLNIENAVFKCDICELTFTDSLGYKDHLNGKKHNMAVGNSLIIKSSCAESVRERLLSKKRERDENKQKGIK